MLILKSRPKVSTTMREIGCQGSMRQRQEEEGREGGKERERRIRRRDRKRKNRNERRPIKA